jgi:hypothetical protein
MTTLHLSQSLVIETGAEANPAGQVRQVLPLARSNQFFQSEIDQVLLRPQAGEGERSFNQFFIENDVGSHGSLLNVYIRGYHTHRRAAIALSQFDRSRLDHRSEIPAPGSARRTAHPEMEKL